MRVGILAGPQLAGYTSDAFATKLFRTPVDEQRAVIIGDRLTRVRPNLLPACRDCANRPGCWAFQSMQLLLTFWPSSYPLEHSRSKRLRPGHHVVGRPPAAAPRIR